jgi:hypothetical protein
MVLGGGWQDLAGNCRSAFRHYGFPNDHFFDLGFRVVLASNNPCLNNNGGCLAGQTCSMSSGGRICTPPTNTCGVVQCTGNLSSECQTFCGGVCVPVDNHIGSPWYCDNTPPTRINTCAPIGCNTDSECRNFCGGVCLPPGNPLAGDLGHCDNSYNH